jgi:hypothetical protein
MAAHPIFGKKPASIIDRLLNAVAAGWLFSAM